jgi:cytochrome c-type biogenesis protein CcsB
MAVPEGADTPLSTLGKSVLFFAYAALCVSLLALLTQYRGRLADYLPKPHVIEEISYRAISVGFLFFTIATILGAMWAADAWGGYWSWDPKETWALIVWVNYACWLHLRLIKGVRTEVLAWWAIIGLFLTTFAFLGVNMLLTGLHSYGKI